MSFCTRCGRRSMAGERFCAACGAPLIPDAARPAAPKPGPAEQGTGLSGLSGLPGRVSGTGPGSTGNGAAAVPLPDDSRIPPVPSSRGSRIPPVPLPPRTASGQPAAPARRSGAGDSGHADADARPSELRGVTTFGDLAREHKKRNEGDKADAGRGRSSSAGTGRPGSGYGSQGSGAYRRGASIGTSTSAADSGSFGWAVLGFFVPLVGFILFLAWKNSRPSNAYRCRNGAIAGVTANIILGLVMRAISYAVVQNLNDQITTSQSVPESSGLDDWTQEDGSGDSSSSSSDSSGSSSSASDGGSGGSDAGDQTSSAPVASDAYKPRGDKDFYSYDGILIADGYPNGISPSDPGTIAEFEKTLRENILPLYGFDPISDQPAQGGGVNVSCSGVLLDSSINNGYPYTIKFNYGDGTITYTNWYYTGTHSTPIATATWTLDYLKPCGVTSSAVSSIPEGVSVTYTYYNKDGSVDHVGHVG